MKGYQDINGIMGDTEPSPVSITGKHETKEVYLSH